MAFIKGLAALLTAVAAILSALVTIRGQWDLLFAQPSVGAAITVAATGDPPDDGGSKPDDEGSKLDPTMGIKSRVVQPTEPEPQSDEPKDFSTESKSRVAN